MDQSRLDAIGFAETAYDEALVKLRETTTRYRESGSTEGVLAAQKAVAEADQILSRVRYSTRNIQELANPETRDINFDQAKEQRKLFSGTDPFKKKLSRIINLEHNPYNFYGKYVESGPDTETGVDIDSQVDKAIPSEGERPGAASRMVVWPESFLMSTAILIQIPFSVLAGPSNSLSMRPAISRPYRLSRPSGHAWRDRKPFARVFYARARHVRCAS
jgi:hypothetical protein